MKFEGSKKRYIIWISSLTLAESKRYSTHIQKKTLNLFFMIFSHCTVWTPPSWDSKE